MAKKARARFELVEVLGGFEIWDYVQFRNRPAYTFPRRESAVVARRELEWWERRGAVCDHPRAWVQRGRCLVTDPETKLPVTIGLNGGGFVYWDECRLCGTRFNSRMVLEDGTVTTRGRPYR